MKGISQEWPKWNTFERYKIGQIYKSHKKENEEHSSYLKYINKKLNISYCTGRLHSLYPNSCQWLY